MILFKRSLELINYLQAKVNAKLKIGFAPTMGALHEGHISLITESKKNCDITVCSIFVNPTQFNDPKDFQKYPITLEKDIYLLEKNGTDILFLPQAQEIYPSGTKDLEHYELGYLESILEGKYRQGHFQGVCQVMSRLLTIVQPDFLFMGQKDYQQCMIVKRLLQIMNLNAKFITCATLRESDGLAMSSRNLRLNAKQRINATGIYQVLTYIKENIESENFNNVLAVARSILESKDFKIDYVEIADANDLRLLNNWDGKQKIVALIAAFQDEIRLIDNMILNSEHN